MEDNSLLFALTLIERIEPQLKIEKREQINRISLEMISRVVKQSLKYLGCKKQEMFYALVNLFDAADLMEELLDDVDFEETTMEVKELLTDKIMKGLDIMYVEIGKYYTTNHFKYSLRLEPVLIRIINACIRNGYYFGEITNQMSRVQEENGNEIK